MQCVWNTKRKKGTKNHAKKKTIQYIERDEQKREEFIAKVEALPEDTDFYYIDESSFDEYYSRDYGYSPRGEKIIGKVSGKHFERTSVVAAVFLGVLIASFAFKGSMNGDLFEGWFEQIFVPEIKNPEKSVVFIDNASHHKKDAIYDIADEYGFKVMFIPPYSPDFNKPVENKWANIKNRLRQHMHKFDDFWDCLVFAFN